jgi:hypothetical protein
MDQSKSFPAWIGIACTWIGAAVGIFAVTAMATGLKATFTPDMRTVEIFRSFLDRASIVAFGVSAALMIAGAVLGRRRKKQLLDEGLLRSGVGEMPPEFSQRERDSRDRISRRDSTE